MVLTILVLLGCFLVYSIANYVFQTKRRKFQRMRQLSQLGQRMFCAHVYSEVPDREQADPQSDMNVAIANLYTYDVRCRHCGHRTRMTSEDFGRHLIETKRMVA